MVVLLNQVLLLTLVASSTTSTIPSNYSLPLLPSPSPFDIQDDLNKSRILPNSDRYRQWPSVGKTVRITDRSLVAFRIDRYGAPFPLQDATPVVAGLTDIADQIWNGIDNPTRYFLRTFISGEVKVHLLSLTSQALNEFWPWLLIFVEALREWTAQAGPRAIAHGSWGKSQAAGGPVEFYVGFRLEIPPPLGLASG